MFGLPEKSQKRGRKEVVRLEALSLPRGVCRRDSKADKQPCPALAFPPPSCLLSPSSIAACRQKHVNQVRKETVAYSMFTLETSSSGCICERGPDASKAVHGDFGIVASCPWAVMSCIVVMSVRGWTGYTHTHTHMRIQTHMYVRVENQAHNIAGLGD